MIKPLYIILAFTITLSSCKGAHEKNVVPEPMDSAVVASETESNVIADTMIVEENNKDTLSLPIPITPVQETKTSPVFVEPKTSKAYDEGYDNGYDDGYEDGVDRNGYQSSYDESCRYKGKKMKDYEDGYEEGYEDGYYDGKADVSDNPDVDDEYD